MPDPNVTLDEMFDYGYTARILPLSKERALELYNEDLTIYALYPDDRKVWFSNCEFEEHEGYFGIEVVDRKSIGLAKMKTSMELISTRRKILCRTQKSFAIYQLKSGTEFSDYRLVRRIERMGKEIDRDNYNLITPMASKCRKCKSCPKCLYYDFNHDKPDDFIGHLS